MSADDPRLLCAEERVRVLVHVATAQAERIERLERALADVLSTFRETEDVVVVTEERQEAWVAALRGES